MKDRGGFVAGALKAEENRYCRAARSMVALDGDRIDKNILDDYETKCTIHITALYHTQQHGRTSRVRLVYPLTRDVTPEGFVSVSRYLADMLGIDYFDEYSYQPNQLMY